MKKQKEPRLQTKMITLSIIVFATFAALAAIQTTHAQSSNSVTTAWNLNLTLRANNGSTINSNQQPTFAPFDLIQLTANLASRNLTAPNIPVAFNVKGPVTSSYPTEIVTSSTTDNTSSTGIAFRIPLETSEKTVLGTWEIYVNAKTSNGTIHQKATFQVAWPIQVTSIHFLNSKDQNQTVLAPGDVAKASLEFRSNQVQNGNLDLNIQDNAGKVINQTQIQNISFNASVLNQIVYEFKIPADAIFGATSFNIDVFSGSYQDIEIPASQNKTAYFMVGNNTAPIPTSNVTPTSPPFIENTISLFSWILVATGFFTFTSLFIFLRRKPTPKINIQTPNSPSSAPQVPTNPQASPAGLAPEKTINTTITIQLPSTHDTSKIPTPESTSSQEQKQTIINYLTKISSINQRVQGLEAELKIEKEQLDKQITDLNKTLEEQEKAVKDYFDAIRQEIAKITPNLKDRRDNTGK